MESLSKTLLAIVLCFIASNLVFYGNAVIGLNYSVVHRELDYEIRLYTEVSWMSALVLGTSFQRSTKDGFHRIYQYIHGSNFNSTQLAMTAPVLTSISQYSAGIEYCTMMSLFSKENPPQPNPELNLQLKKWKAKCVAVRMFSGFADDSNSRSEMEALAASLEKHWPHNTAIVDNYTNSCIVAQYNSSRQLEPRLNEIWIDVSGFNIEGCVPVK